LNLSVPAVLVLGVGILLYGLVPRLAVPALNVLIAWSFLVQLVGPTLTTNRWLIDTAVLSHIRPAPAAAPDWGSLGWMTGMAVVATAVGFAAFRRRDLVGA
jgi:ABC-2 type transport system permease protein